MPIYVMFTLRSRAARHPDPMERGKPRVSALAPDNATVIDTGEVSAIDNIIDQTTGTAKIRATFPMPPRGCGRVSSSMRAS